MVTINVNVYYIDNNILLIGLKCFTPIHCLEQASRETIMKILSDGLSTIMKRAETTSWNGKRHISPKSQNIIDPYLAAFYNTYSLTASLTDPYNEIGNHVPRMIPFSVAVNYISEGENDSCKVEIILNPKIEIIMFVWKEFLKTGPYLFLRYKRVTWKVTICSEKIISFEYDTNSNELLKNSRPLDKTVGWPKEKISIDLMFKELSEKKKIEKLPWETYKWIKRIPLDYLLSQYIDIDKKCDDGLSLLHYLAKIKDTKYIKCIIEKVTYIDPVDSLGCTPLQIACKYRNYRAAKLLLQHGADVNVCDKNGNTSLMIICDQETHDTSLIKLLLEHDVQKDAENNEKMRAVDFARHRSAPISIINLIHPLYLQM